MVKYQKQKNKKLTSEMYFFSNIYDSYTHPTQIKVGKINNLK